MPNRLLNNGVFGLVSLDGTPIDERDCASIFGSVMDRLWSSADCMLTARDAAVDAVHFARTAANFDLLLGELNELEHAVRTLGLADGTNPAVVAAAAHDRWGANAAIRLAGDWLLVRWDAQGRILTLLTSECLREACYVARDGPRVAIAPDLLRLAQLDWVPDTPDAEMLARAFRRGGTDRSFRRRTLLANVTRLLPGECVRIRAGDVEVTHADPLPPPPLATMSFDMAVAELDRTLRRTMRRELARGGDIAILLSGGLDSSLLGLLAALERRADQRIVFLMSAVPTGSDIPDESAWAEVVARHLDIPLIKVTPDPAADIYRLGAPHYARASGPALSPRHYLYDALEAAALAAGATRIIDGSFGELTVSNHGFAFDEQRWWSPLRRAVRRIRSTARAVAADDFHVQPSAAALAFDVTPPPSATTPHRRHRHGAAFGFDDGYDKAAERPTTGHDPRIRYVYPFRDRELGRLFASLPANFIRHGGVDRAPIRALLRGRLPDKIADRTSKLAFSPTYYAMLRAQAGTARERIPRHRAAGAGEWLDLDWLDRALTQAESGAALSMDVWSRIHMTALAAEFFSWWPDAVQAPVRPDG